MGGIFFFHSLFTYAIGDGVEINFSTLILALLSRKALVIPQSSARVYNKCNQGRPVPISFCAFLLLRVLPALQPNFVISTIGRYLVIVAALVHNVSNENQQLGQAQKLDLFLATRPNGFAETLSFFLEFSFFSLSYEGFFLITQGKN